MSEVYTFHVDGHQLCAVALNAPDTPGHPVILLHGISCSVRFWGADQRACTNACYPDYRRLNLSSLADYFEAMPDIDICDLLQSITVPTLVLAGDCDPVVPPDQARLISQLIPESELVMIEGGGHILFAERSAEYQKALGDWLRKAA